MTQSANQTGRARIRQPWIDLFLDPGDTCRAGLWLPELVLLGNSDRRAHAVGAVSWVKDGPSWRYDHANEGQPLSFAASVDQLPGGWKTELTLRNQSEETLPHVVGTVCLQLPASGGFEDPDWTRTHYRSGGEFLTYAGRACEGGEDTYRMSLVRGRDQIERTARHIKKWGFTEEVSDDGIFAVASEDDESVLTTTWQAVHHLQANSKPAFRCIHTNPYFDNLEPGESKTVLGCVLITHGSLDEAWAETTGVIQQIEQEA